MGGKFLLTSFFLLLSSSLPPHSLPPPSFFPFSPHLRSSHLHIKYSFFSLSSFSGYRYSSGEWLPVVSLRPSSKSQLLGDISGVFPLQLSSPVFSLSSPSFHPPSIPCHPFPALKPRAPRGAGVAQLSDYMWCPCGSMDPCHCPSPPVWSVGRLVLDDEVGENESPKSQRLLSLNCSSHAKFSPKHVVFITLFEPPPPLKVQSCDDSIS